MVNNAPFVVHVFDNEIIEFILENIILTSNNKQNEKSINGYGFCIVRLRRLCTNQSH